MDLKTVLAATRFEHEWLADPFVQETQTHAASEAAVRHHYVPEFYLRRWCVNGELKPVVVDSKTALRPRPPRSVAFERDFYTIPTSAHTSGIPLRWVETHLARIEDKCSKHTAALVEGPIGVVSDLGMMRDMSVFLGFQISRTVAGRQRAMAIVSAPDSAKRKLLTRLSPSATPDEIDQSMQDQLPDRGHGAIRIIIEDVRNILATSILNRCWAVYETANAFVTSDEPVVMVAGPPNLRSSFVGTAPSAILIYPLSPDRVLVMRRTHLKETQNFVLDKDETRSVNCEILATAGKVVFERPTDVIAENLPVPSRPPLVEPDYEHLSDDDAIAMMLGAAAPPSRWMSANEVPPWPVTRWYDVEPERHPSSIRDR
jgi:hypothetical protein